MADARWHLQASNPWDVPLHILQQVLLAAEPEIHLAVLNICPVLSLLL